MQAFIHKTKSLLQVQEVLFLIGVLFLFVGIAGIWSIYGALVVCGAILTLTGLAAAIISQPRGT